MKAPPHYDFRYTVGDRDAYGSQVDFGHQETRDLGHTSGSYYILLPDSRVMKVVYYADETGFHPEYTYEGEAELDLPQLDPFQRLNTYEGGAKLDSPEVDRYPRPSRLYSSPSEK
nr:pro-resilin-like [Cherax quadricarinatus]